MRPLVNKCLKSPCLVFALVLAWKLALFIFSAQPVPANDAFFYDGAVVNKLVNGVYANPSLAEALPISGKQLFSAYPPFYQVVLFVWMSVLGTSAISAMALHFVLFAGYATFVCLILRRLQTPVWCLHFAGVFLLLLTFHDRPDSLAHFLGMASVYAWIRSRRTFHGGNTVPHAECWLWLMSLCAILTLCTSLQIGSVYFLWIWFGMVATSLAGKEKFPLAPMVTMTLLPVTLAAVVKGSFPLAWDGFMEHALQTPSFTGWRLPHLEELLKVARTAPGIFLVAVLLPWSWMKQHNDVAHAQYARQEFVLLPALLGALGIVVACLFLLTANTVAIANYLQPIIVATYLAFCAMLFAGQRWLRTQILCLSLAALLGSIRAVGMTTWGLACSTDVGYPTAMRQVDAALSDLPTGATVVASSAFLYQTAQHTNLTLIHSDWMGKAKTDLPDADLRALVALRPRRLILTQFDYYRRYQRVLDQAASEPSLKKIEIFDSAHLRPPDASKLLQRVVQHVSWAPIVVNLTWQEGP